MKKTQPRGRPRLNNVRVNVMFEPEIHSLIAKRAERENRQFSNMLNVMVREGVAANSQPQSQ